MGVQNCKSSVSESSDPPFWSCAPIFLYPPKFNIRTIARVRSSSEPYLLQLCYIIRCPTWGEGFARIRDGGGGGPNHTGKSRVL